MGYLQLLRDVCTRGERRVDRTGTGTMSLFAPEPLRFDMSASAVPIYTTKRVAWKTVIKELLWFVKGHTDARLLQEQGVHIWDGHTSKAFLSTRSLPYREGILGPGYGWQWRRFGAPYDERLADVDMSTMSTMGVDQLGYVERMLRKDRFSRRIFLSSWNASDLDKMALVPCHVSCQFHVSNHDELSCHVYMRSNDLFLGNPFNVLSYAALTHLLAKRTSLKPKELVMSFGDAHVYLDHLPSVETQLARTPFQFPTMTVDDRVQHIEYKDLCLEDFCINNYSHHPALSGRMSV